MFKTINVAVIIPFYNGSAWIERAIKSVVDQTIPPAEFVVVNDGSKPEECVFLESLQNKYQFHILNKENGGQASARNAGVRATASDYICFLDQDDFYLPRHIEDLSSALAVLGDDPNFGYIYGDFAAANEVGEINHSNALRQKSQMRKHPKVGHIIDIVSDDLFVLPSASMISRKAFEAVGGFDPQFKGYEDDDLFLRMFRAGYTSHFVDKAVYVWCMHGSSTSWSVTMSRSRFLYFKKLLVNYPDDLHNRIYFVRDGLVPRFGPTFLREAIRARYGHIEHKAEILQYYREFVAAVTENPFVKKKIKRRLRFAAFVVTYLPVAAFVVSRIVRREARNV